MTASGKKHPLSHSPARVAADGSLDDRLRSAVREQLRDTELVQSLMELAGRQTRPVVLDANRLRGEIRTVAKSGHDTALVTLARTGFLRMFAAPHVIAEVDRYHERWASETGIPVAAYSTAWMTTIRPLITVVSFSRDLLTDNERARIERLDRPPPAGDPDDVPTAIASMVLAAPLLSRDRAPLTAVYGPDLDMSRHDGYVNALLGGGRVLVVSQWGHVALMVAQLIGALGTSGIRALTSKTGAMPLLLGTLAATSMAASSEWARLRLVRSADPVRAAGRAFIGIYAFYREAEADFGRLATPRASDLDELPPHTAAAREHARRSALA